MKFSKKRVLFTATVVVVTSIGAGFAYHNLQTDPNSSGSSITTAADRERGASPSMNHNGTELVVRAFSIEPDSAPGTKHAFTGTVQPRYHAAMAFRVAGKISERLVEVGQRIKKGQTLFRIDPEDFELQLRVAEADKVSAVSLLQQTTAEELRLKKLRSSGSVSQSDYDLGLANRDVAKARVDAAERRLTLAMNQRTYCDLLADSDGIVTSIQAEAGQVVNIGQSVLQLTQTDELEAVVSLPEHLVSSVKNMKAMAKFWSNASNELPAELRELSPMADPVSRTYDAKFRFSQPPRELAIGMTVTISLNADSDQGICIPITAIAARNDAPIVWRIDPNQGHVEAIPIEVIEYRNETAVVRGSFHATDRIVSAGTQRIDEKSRVRVWEYKK